MIGKALFSILGVIFFLQGILVVYVFSPWGPAYHATKEELPVNLAFLGFPASFFASQ